MFHSRAWSRLTKSDLNKLQVVQIKFLKRMMETALSTPNVCIFLELGILPITNEIHIRKLTFLHHILNCEEADPVYMMYSNQNSLPFEKNWANETLALRELYNICLTDDAIKVLSKKEWKNTVKEKIYNTTFQQLKTIAASKSKSKLFDVHHL